MICATEHIDVMHYKLHQDMAIIILRTEDKHVLCHSELARYLNHPNFGPSLT
jgi:hypothetical protein